MYNPVVSIVFPACAGVILGPCAGVILEEQEKAMNTKGVPRVCGGDPGLKRA